MVCYNSYIFSGSRSISQCKSSSSALAAQAAYLNPSPFSTSFSNSNSQNAPQNAYCYTGTGIKYYILS